MKKGVIVERTTVEAIIDARRGRSRLVDRFNRTLLPSVYDQLIATAENHQSSECELEDKILRATIEAAARMEGFDGPLESTLNARLVKIFRQIDGGDVSIIFPDQ